MIRRTIGLVWSLVVLGCVAYVFFFVPLGKRTLFEHVFRIAQTDEAKELGDEAVEAGERLTTDLEERIDHLRDAGPDAGAL